MVTKKHSKATTGAGKAAPIAAAGATPVRLIAKDESTCEAALKRVIGLARALPPGAVPVDAVPADAAPMQKQAVQAKPEQVASRSASGEGAPSSQARQSLQAALDGLDSEVAQKLRTLFLAGRAGTSIGDANTDGPESDAKSALAAAALDGSTDGPQFADCLRRGHALACATAIDVERPFAGWSSTAPHSLDERAWLSFGKQLAKSEPSDWQCFALMQANTQAISRLYLRLADHSWWSFQALLDRPSVAVVESQRRTLARRRSKSLSTASLATLVSALSTVQGRALQRAARAIRARVGEAAAAT
jgi:hypothetical protein